MAEPSAGGDQSGGFLDRLCRRGNLLWHGVSRDVRSSLTVSINIESSVALLVFYGVLGYTVALNLNQGAS